jgi:anti-sigma28 factor (negative regulator of flagellin synthesis)
MAEQRLFGVLKNSFSKNEGKTVRKPRQKTTPVVTVSSGDAIATISELGGVDAARAKIDELRTAIANLEGAISTVEAAAALVTGKAA